MGHASSMHNKCVITTNVHISITLRQKSTDCAFIQTRFHNDLGGTCSVPAERLKDSFHGRHFRHCVSMTTIVCIVVHSVNVRCSAVDLFVAELQ